MSDRPRPIYFWDYDTGHEVNAGLEPYIEPALQKGTTPLVKKLDGRLTRDFRNLHHPTITASDFHGSRAILDHRYKLVVHDSSGDSPLSKELFDLYDDPAEKDNLIEKKSEIAHRLELLLHTWQESVLKSLTGADYR
jgi:arylsulfatase A-like enzyme